MERNGNNDVDRVRFEESVAALGHEPAERLSKRYFTAVFEALDHAAERMLLAIDVIVPVPRQRSRFRWSGTGTMTSIACASKSPWQLSAMSRPSGFPSDTLRPYLKRWTTLRSGCSSRSSVG